MIGEVWRSPMMTHPALSLDIRRIVTDSDLDGVVTGAILRRWWKDAEVVFGHPGALRAGLLDDCLLYTSPSPRDRQKSRMPSSA